jgi:hypothetical protein
MKQPSIGSIAGLCLITVAMAARSAAQSAKETEAKIGCKLDANQVCQQALTHPVDTGSLVTSNNSYIAENGPATIWMMAPVKTPGGSEIDVQCQVNYEKKQVIYAYPTVTTTLSDKDRQWLQSTGMCIGTNATEKAPKINVEE